MGKVSSTVYFETIWTSACLHYQFLDNLIIKMQFCSLKSTFCGIWSCHYWVHKILQSINKVISQMFSGGLPCWHKISCNGLEYSLINKCLKIAAIFPNFQWNFGMSLDVHISRTTSNIDLRIWGSPEDLGWVDMERPS